MIPLLIRLWPALLAIVVVAGIWFHGRETGRIACQAAYAAEVEKARAAADEAARETRAKEAQRIAAEAERERLAQELEDAAYAEPVSNPACLSADRVRRLNGR